MAKRRQTLNGKGSLVTEGVTSATTAVNFELETDKAVVRCCPVLSFWCQAGCTVGKTRTFPDLKTNTSQ